jgi:hypothetical protein
MKKVIESKFENYLFDLGLQIKDYALQAKKDAVDQSKNDSEFKLGYLCGFHRVVSLMQQQAIAFGIPFKDIGLENIDADTDLV